MAEIRPGLWLMISCVVRYSSALYSPGIVGSFFFHWYTRSSFRVRPCLFLFMSSYLFIFRIWSWLHYALLLWLYIYIYIYIQIPRIETKTQCQSNANAKWLITYHIFRYFILNAMVSAIFTHFSVNWDYFLQ